MIKDDYARAKVPMLPVVQGEEMTRLQILLYSILLSGLVIAFAVSTSRLGIIYVSGAAVLSAWFIVEAVRLVRRKNKAAAWSTYRYSLLYLFLLFGLIMADASIS
jgi:protoheme IX farnesyltransferase